MVRLINFCCFALSALACLALYHVSEQTRVASAELHHVDRQIVQERNAMTVLQAEWARVADPARIQKLAEADLHLSDQPTVVLSALTMLPRRGSADAVGGAQMRTANATAPTAHGDGRVRLASIRVRD